jgi:opacity protein-like surface antigen
MKNVIFVIIFCSASIFAQNNFYLSSNAGLNLSYPKAPFNNIWGLSYNLGIGIGYNFTEDLSTEIIYQYNKHQLSTFSYEGNSNYQFINSYLMRWNYILSNINSFKPYISLGIGISSLELNSKKSSNILSLFPGVGLKYDISKNIGIKFFIEYAQLDIDYISNEDLKYFPFQLGFQYNL